MTILEMIAHALCVTAPFVISAYSKQIGIPFEDRRWYAIATCAPCFLLLVNYVFQVITTRRVDVQTLFLCLMCCLVGYMQIRPLFSLRRIDISNIRK